MDDLISRHTREKFSQGSLEAFHKIYEAYYPVGVNYARRIMPHFHIEDCRDAVQDTFINLFRLRKNFDPARNFNPYFFRSLRNNVFKTLHKAGKESRMKSDLKSEHNIVVIDFAGKDSEKDFESAFESLNTDQREAITLRYINDLKIAQIAELTGVNENTVKTRIFYGLRSMKAELMKGERI